MYGQLLIDDVQQIGVGQYVEEVVSVDGSRTLPDTVTLRPTRSAIRVHGAGGLVGRLFGLDQQFARPPATLSNQLLGADRVGMRRLSKCHSGQGQFRSIFSTMARLTSSVSVSVHFVSLGC
jgi:hypothetical protein